MFTLIIMALVAIITAVAAVVTAGKMTLTKVGFGSFEELSNFIGTARWVIAQEMIERNNRFEKEWQELRDLAAKAQAEAQAKRNSTLTQ